MSDHERPRVTKGTALRLSPFGNPIAWEIRVSLIYEFDFSFF